MIVPNPLCPQRKVVLMPGGAAMCCSALPKRGFSFAWSAVTSQLRLGIEASFLICLKTCGLNMNCPWPADPGSTPHLYLLPSSCFSSSVASATVLLVIPKPCRQLGSLFSLMKNPVVSFYPAFSMSSVGPVHPRPSPSSLYFPAGHCCDGYLWLCPHTQSPNQALIMFSCL